MTHKCRNETIHIFYITCEKVLFFRDNEKKQHKNIFNWKKLKINFRNFVNKRKECHGFFY